MSSLIRFPNEHRSEDACASGVIVSAFLESRLSKHEKCLVHFDRLITACSPKREMLSKIHQSRGQWLKAPYLCPLVC